MKDKKHHKVARGSNKLCWIMGAPSAGRDATMVDTRINALGLRVSCNRHVREK